ncbi:MAG TPA: alpha/beta fold hydrolase [Jiangellaceae bacterium]|nr:alpha/beta fold hydrolase [Jiangellaceae bacterium]
MIEELRVQAGGDGEPVLLLLHGLGATGDVWNGWATLLDAQWPGRWLAPDLPGHGGSDPLPRYSFGAVAASVANLVRPDERLVVLGHSMGGVVGLALASGWFGVRVEAVVGLGIKVSWTDDELARVRGLAERPVAWFDSQEEAASRYLRVSGLAGLLAPDSPATGAGLVEEGGRWRLAQDPATFAVGAPDMAGLLAASRAEVTLARGEHDQMVTGDQLAELAPSVVTLPGLGHNAHVEDPAAVLRLLVSARR